MMVNKGDLCRVDRDLYYVVDAGCYYMPDHVTRKYTEYEPMRHWSGRLCLLTKAKLIERTQKIL